MGEALLKVAFKSLYGLALDPDGMVVDSFDFEGNIWILRLRRNLNNCEVDEMTRLLSMVERIRPNSRMLDDCDWVLNRNGKFSSKSLYLKMVVDRFLGFPHTKSWIQSIPSKVTFFLWTIFLDKILTLDYLRSR